MIGRSQLEVWGAAISTKRCWAGSSPGTSRQPAILSQSQEIPRSSGGVGGGANRARPRRGGGGGRPPRPGRQPAILSQSQEIPRSRGVMIGVSNRVRPRTVSGIHPFPRGIEPRHCPASRSLDRIRITDFEYIGCRPPGSIPVSASCESRARPPEPGQPGGTDVSVIFLPRAGDPGGAAIWLMLASLAILTAFLAGRGARARGLAAFLPAARENAARHLLPLAEAAARARRHLERARDPLEPEPAGLAPGAAAAPP